MTTYDYLIEHNIKPSVQRLAVMDYLMQHRTHPNADEIYRNLQEQMPTLSRTTIYNTLKILSAGKAAMMLTIDEKNVCYDADTSAHAHFLCSECSRVTDMPFTQDNLLKEDARRMGYKVDEAHLYYRGVCPDCLKKNTHIE